MKHTWAIGVILVTLLIFASIGLQPQTVNMGRTYLAPGAVRYANEAGTGTTLNKLAKLTGAPSTAILADTSDTSGIVGIVISGAGTTGNADVAVFGKATCVFDSATTAGHYVINDTSTAGDCMDGGATYPTSGQVIGVVTSTNGGAGTYEVDLSLGQPQAGGSGGGGGESVIAIGALPGICTSGTAFSFSDSLYRAVCYPANTYSYFHRSHLVVPPSAAGWSWDNQGTASVDSTYGYEYMTAPFPGSSNLRVRHMAAPATPYTIKAVLLADYEGIVGASGDLTDGGIFIGWREASTGKLVISAIQMLGSGFSQNFAKWTNSTTWNSNYGAYGNGFGTGTFDGKSPIFMAMRDDGTDLSVYLSTDGLHWHQNFSSQSRTDFMGGGPDQIGFGIYTQDSLVHLALISWVSQAAAP